jgi:hypothetical protein
MPAQHHESSGWREKAPRSMAVTAICIARSGVVASIPVTNSRIFARPFQRSLPSVRRTLARHFPGSRSNAWTVNFLYSIGKVEYAPRASDLAWFEIKVRLRAIAAKSADFFRGPERLRGKRFAVRDVHSVAFILQFNDPPPRAVGDDEHEPKSSTVQGGGKSAMQL